MTYEEFTAAVQKSAADAPNMGKSLKLQFPEGPVHIDMTQDETVVTNEDKEADTVVITELATLDKLRRGELNPMMAMMSGKVKIKGDMGLAMKLQSFLA